MVLSAKSSSSSQVWDTAAEKDFEFSCVPFTSNTICVRHTLHTVEREALAVFQHLSSICACHPYVTQWEEAIIYLPSTQIWTEKQDTQRLVPISLYLQSESPIPLMSAYIAIFVFLHTCVTSSVFRHHLAVWYSCLVYGIHISEQSNTCSLWYQCTDNTCSSKDDSAILSQQPCCIGPAAAESAAAAVDFVQRGPLSFGFASGSSNCRRVSAADLLPPCGRGTRVTGTLLVPKREKL